MKRVINPGVDLDLLVTSEMFNDSSIVIEKIALTEDRIVHLSACFNAMDDNPSGAKDVVVFSIYPSRGIIFGPINIGRYNTRHPFDLISTVHYNMFFKNILGIMLNKDAESSNETPLSKYMTKYCSSLSYQDCRLILVYLLRVHESNTSNRVKNPRKTRLQEFENDKYDRFVSLFIRRIVAIMNNFLYWGDSDYMKFNLEA